MSSFIVVASKFTLTPKVITINNGRSIIRRGLAVAHRFGGTGIGSFHRNFTPKRANDRFSSNCRHFGVSSVDLSSIKANLDPNNVLRSPLPDIDGFTGTLVHELVYRDLDRWSDKTALVCSATGRSYTYAETKKFSGRLANSLRKSGLRSGDTVATILPNVPEYAFVVLAASEAGLRVTLINPAYTPDEIRSQLKNSDAAAVITVTAKHAVAAASIADNPNLRFPIIVIEDGNDSAPEGTIKFADLIKDGIEEFNKTGEHLGIDAEDTFILPYSSGTSGLPKGVELCHRSLVANIIQLRAKGVKISSDTTASYQEIVPVVLPIYHIYGFAVVLALYLCLGGKLVCVPQFSPENFVKVLENYRSTLLYLAPPLVHLLAVDQKFNKHHFETVKTIVSGAAPLGEEVLAKFFNKTPSTVNFIQGYGLTECSPVISMSAKSPHTSIGHVLPSTEVRIVGFESENLGKNLGFDEVGEIFIRGPQVMKGYYKNPEATTDCMEGEWFKTGDLACYDKSGLLYIRGRLKELIKVQGFQVAPAEIEDLIQGHPKVMDAAVIGVAHERFGEIPKAFVVPKKGAKLETEEIKDWIAERVVKYKRLGHVEFVEKIPKSAAGKILRRELQKM